MSRVDDWWPRLKETFHRFEDEPWQWGKSDCACFAAECVQAVTGRDVLGTFRNAYGSRLAAFARLRFRGYRTLADATADALKAVGGQELDPRFAQCGDIGVTADDVLAVRMPQGFIARTPEGKFGVAKVVRAWAVAWV